MTVPIVVPMQYGWTCTQCGRSNAPFVQTCPCWHTKPPKQRTQANTEEDA